MWNKRNYILIIALVLMIFSCKNVKKTNSTFINNSRKIDVETIELPEKTVFRNLEIDTTKLFGTWVQDQTAPFADFHISRGSFNIIDYDGGGVIPYILEKKQITMFYRNASHKGIITSTKNDTLKIKWLNNEKETEYVKFEYR